MIDIIRVPSYTINQSSLRSLHFTTHACPFDAVDFLTFLLVVQHSHQTLLLRLHSEYLLEFISPRSLKLQFKLPFSSADFFDLRAILHEREERRRKESENEKVEKVVVVL